MGDWASSVQIICSYRLLAQLSSRFFEMAVEETVLGSGAFGTVVKKNLPGGDVVAEKMINSALFDYTNDSPQLKNELFKQECVR